MANGLSYRLGFYLVDKIYPEWVTLLNLISHLNDNEHNRAWYKRMHEVARKDEERIFSVLKKN